MVTQGYTADYLTSILNAFKDLIFLFDDEGVILDYLQSENSELLYVPREQFIRKHHRDVLPPHVSERIHEAISEIRKGKAAFAFDYDLPIGGRISWFTAVFSPIRKDPALPANYLCVIREITERKENELLLQRYRLLANNMIDLVALHEPDGTYKYVSPSVIKVLGYSPEELIGTDPYRLIHPDDIATLREQPHKKAIDGEEISDAVYRIQKKDGQYIWFSTNAKPITDSQGKVTMLQTVSRDVTERIDTLLTLKELNHQKNKLFSVIAHDLRAPLASCMGLLNLTQRELSAEDLKKFLLLARKSAFNLHELMEDLLLWAGSQLNKVTFDPTILNVSDEIETVSRRFEDIAQSKEITVNVDVGDEELYAVADRDMIRTIIRNLLSNAIKFTTPKGRVDIRARSNSGFIEISVKDNGIGINEEDIDKLFSKTSTFTTYGTNGEKGTGLGLDICRDFVERHGGKIRVESDFGKGSQFIFTLKEF